ncbi:MAG: hypothetical protein EXX96DRAFT_375200 [Benjaminiella poitrasii]|nr:MAG: hypothetical protein EXX96DRAFT_375200 [Benjaminiella poitrasii]
MILLENHTLHGNSMFYSLPSEIIWNIIQMLEPIDLSIARSVSKCMRAYCDHPELWKNICLIPRSTDEGGINKKKSDRGAINLWRLSTLKAILQPHLNFIKKVRVWGVRDNIVRYLIENCYSLQDLTIVGWCTLSDHAFRLNPSFDQKILCLNRLKLIGHQKSSFTSMDGTTLGRFIRQCPQLEEVFILNCQVHLHADSLLQTFCHNVSSKDNSHIISSLKTLTVPTKRTWTGQNVARLFELCSNLEMLTLVPDSDQFVDIANIIHSNSALGVNDVEYTKSIPVMNIAEENYSQPFIVEKSLQSIKDEELFAEDDNIIIYREY